MVANMSAFNEEVASKAKPRDFLLTQSEVKHIRWCASQHPSYHATDNSILGQNGNREQCVSPAWDVAGIHHGYSLLKLGLYQVRDD